MSWRPMLETALGTHRDDPTARYFQLATIGLDDRPANRTVVFRGFRADSDGVLFTADARSRKVAEIARTPFAQACWYFPDTREQFRLAGTLSRADASLSAEVWRNLADPVRTQFTWPTPGADWDDDSSFRSEPPDRSNPPGVFAVFILKVETVDYLSLKAEPPLRLRFESAGESRRINP